MSYFSDNSIEESDRRNNAFQLLCAMREAVTIAKKTQQAIPYRRTVDLIKDISPDLHKDITNLLTKTNESEIVRYYKQKAEASSNETEAKISPQQLIEKDLKEEKRVLALGGESTNLIERKIFELEAALEYFKPEDISENYILNHDFTLERRHEFFEKKLYENAKIKDYALSGNRILRLRLLHPDKAERIIGSDLVYEQFDLKTKSVRFIHMQYKTWNSKMLYFSHGNLLDQIEKLDKNLCQSGFCHNSSGSKHSQNYRFPYCSAFLRPTSYLEHPESYLISSGIHLPICMVNKIKENEKAITQSNSKQVSVGNNIFEDLFLNQHIGSRWMKIEELERFYAEKNITSQLGRIRVHAQEVHYETEEERNKER